MANGRNPRQRTRVDQSRDSGGFVALPWAVLDAPAFSALSHPARSLLLELARQHVPGKNGRLLASKNFLARRGWRSADVITRAKRELLAAGFIHETVKGRRPNRASWYALTWYSLERHRDFDEGAFELFERSAYSRSAAQNTGLRPSGGAKARSIAPPRGHQSMTHGPCAGAVRDAALPFPMPPRGHLLKGAISNVEPQASTSFH